MFTSARILVLAALTAAGLLAAPGSAHAQHRRAYGGVYHGGYAPSYYHGYAPRSAYHYSPGYVYPAAGYHSGGASYYRPYSWHGGAVYTPSYHGSYYHVGPAYPAAGYYGGYVIRH